MLMQSKVSMHVETVVLLSQQKADDYIEVELELDELDLTSAESISGFAGYFGKYVTVFLAGKNMNLFIELKRGAKIC